MLEIARIYMFYEQNSAIADTRRIVIVSPSHSA